MGIIKSIADAYKVDVYEVWEKKIDNTTLLMGTFESKRGAMRVISKLRRENPNRHFQIKVSQRTTSRGIIHV